MYAPEAVPEYTVAMIWEVYFPTKSEDDLTDAQGYEGVTEEYGLGYQGGPGGAFVEEV